MLRLVELCAALGGSYLVHGSPGQRRIAPERQPAGGAWTRGRVLGEGRGGRRQGGRHLLHRAPVGGPDAARQYARGGGRDRAAGRFAGLADHARYQLGGPGGEAAGGAIDRPLVPDRLRRARAIERPQPARTGAGRGQVHAGACRVEAQRLPGLAGDGAVRLPAPTGRAAPRARSATCRAYSKRWSRDARDSRCLLRADCVACLCRGSAGSPRGAGPGAGEYAAGVCARAGARRRHARTRYRCDPRRRRGDPSRSGAQPRYRARPGRKMAGRRRARRSVRSRLRNSSSTTSDA